jgi:hypothetical protein
MTITEKQVHDRFNLIDKWETARWHIEQTAAVVMRQGLPMRHREK